MTRWFLMGVLIRGRTRLHRGPPRPTAPHRDRPRPTLSWVSLRRSSSCNPKHARILPVLNSSWIFRPRPGGGGLEEEDFRLRAQLEPPSPPSPVPALSSLSSTPPPSSPLPTLPTRATAFLKVHALFLCFDHTLN